MLVEAGKYALFEKMKTTLKRTFVPDKGELRGCSNSSNTGRTNLICPRKEKRTCLQRESRQIFLLP
jgi:hypothetical protein